MDVVEVPSNRKIIRDDRPDRIYKNEAGKFKAIVNEVKMLHTKGQPVLIGTVSIEKNELLGQLLSNAGVPYEVLNAKNNEKEANIIVTSRTKGCRYPSYQYSR